MGLGSLSAIKVAIRCKPQGRVTMAVLERLERLLEENGISYRHHVHTSVYTAREVAALEHLPQHRFAKAVLIKDEDSFVMAVVPGDYAVDLHELRAALGLKHARLATEKELGEQFPDCELGAMPPLGNLYSLPTWMESSIVGEKQIAFNAGTHRDVVYVKLEDFRRLTSPQVFHFCRPTAH